MSASSLMMLGIKAMAANYAALQTTGHNIANANVDGYSRQRAELATAEPQYTGAGFFGKGVNVATVTRAHDQFLTREASSARSLASMDATRLALLQRMETIFQPGENGLGNASTQLMNAMSDLSSNPATRPRAASCWHARWTWRRASAKPAARWTWRRPMPRRTCA
jgi:flagellar hook-associated protein 1 FlgK